MKCPYCKKDSSVRHGVRKNKSGWVRINLCKSCNRHFTLRNGFEKMKTKPEIIVTALDLRAKGVTLGKIKDHLFEKYGIKVKRAGILYWQKKFGKIINDFTKQFVLTASENAHADEVFFRIKGSKKDEFIYYWDCIDYDTKFILGDLISNARTEEFAFEFLSNVNKKIEKPPDYIHTDCSFDYPRPVKLVFKRKTKHIAKPAWKHGFKNNPIERFHNTLKENYKVMRRFVNIQSAYRYLTFFRDYYNFLRRHKTLEFKTPAEIAGFGSWNWWTIIKSIYLRIININYV